MVVTLQGPAENPAYQLYNDDQSELYILFLHS
jgi:hypothetical protein